MDLRYLQTFKEIVREGSFLGQLESYLIPNRQLPFIWISLKRSWIPCSLKKWDGAWC